MENNDERITLATLKTDLEYIKRDISEIKSTLKSDYVTRDEFSPIKSIVYGLVGIVLTAVVGALVALVVKQ
jgi:hypothetical protein